MGLAVLEQEVLKKWKSYRRLYTFLEREFERINRECFRGLLPKAEMQLRRMRFCKDPFSGGYIAAVYGPAKPDRPAQMGFFPIVLLHKRDALIALAHEMIHHWEWVFRERLSHAQYPQEVTSVIRKQFDNPEEEYTWRLAHSHHFIAKAREVARHLELPFQEFLFKDSLPKSI